MKVVEVGSVLPLGKAGAITEDELVHKVDMVTTAGRCMDCQAQRYRGQAVTACNANTEAWIQVLGWVWALREEKKAASV